MLPAKRNPERDAPDEVVVVPGIAEVALARAVASSVTVGRRRGRGVPVVEAHCPNAGRNKFHLRAEDVERNRGGDFECRNRPLVVGEVDTSVADELPPVEPMPGFDAERQGPEGVVDAVRIIVREQNLDAGVRHEGVTVGDDEAPAEESGNRRHIVVGELVSRFEVEFPDAVEGCPPAGDERDAVKVAVSEILVVAVVAPA